MACTAGASLGKYLFTLSTEYIEDLLLVVWLDRHRSDQNTRFIRLWDQYAFHPLQHVVHDQWQPRLIMPESLSSDDR